MKASGSADTRDYDLAAVEITSGQNTSGPVKLDIGGDDDDVGVETLMFDATVSGDKDEGTETLDVAAVLSIDIDDATEKKVGPKGTAEELQAVIDAAVGDGLNPGDSFTIMGSELFTPPMDGYAVTYSTSVSGDGSVTAPVSGGTITVNAIQAGESQVTVTATATAAASSATISQTVSNVASVTFDVSVTDTPLVVTVTAESPTEIMEGEVVALRARANRPITEGDTTDVNNEGSYFQLRVDIIGDDGDWTMGWNPDDIDGSSRDDHFYFPVGAVDDHNYLRADEDDDLDNERLTVLVSGPGITGTERITIEVTDNDEPPAVEPTVRAVDGAAGMIAEAISTAAGGGDWMVGGMVATIDMATLFDPDDGVSVSYSGSSSDQTVVSDVTTGGNMLALTPMGAGTATITVTGTDTAGGGSATVTHDATVALQTLDVTVSASADMVMEGGSVTLTATANRAVTEAAMLSVTVTGDTDAVVADGMITIEAGGTSGTATVTAVEDDDSANAAVSVVVSGSVLASPATFDISIEDNDPTVSARTQAEVTAVFVTAVAMAGGAGGWLPGGDGAEVDMSELFKTNGDPTVDYRVESSAPDMVAASATGMMLTLTPMATGDATITVTATDASGDMHDTAAVMADVTVGVLPLEIMVSPTTAEVTEGGTVEITATANKMVDANVEVMLVRDAASSAGADD